MNEQEELSETQSRISDLGFWRDLGLISLILVIGLVYGSGFLIPLTTALLMFVLLTALSGRLKRIEVSGTPIPGWLANLVGLGIIFGSLSLVVLVLANQWTEVTEAFPRYQDRFAGILASLIAVVGQENADAVMAALETIDVTSWFTGALGTAGSFLSALFLVLLYIPYLMAEREPMRRKIAAAADSSKTEKNIHNLTGSISDRLQKYVGVKSMVSALTGIASYAVMKPVGLDFAETWAVLAFLLNFIPSIGSVVAVILPTLVALVQFDTAMPIIIVVVGCGIIQFSIGNVLEPSLMGKSLNLSPFVVILALTFWTTVWGIPGALLSVPFTVCIMIVLADLPKTRWLAVLMSGDGKLGDNKDPRVEK